MPKTIWGTGKRALFVGPEHGALAVAVAAVEGAGFHLLRCGTTTALSVFDEHHVEVAYLDGEASGALQLLRQVMLVHPDARVVLVKVAPAATDVADAMRAGAADVVATDTQAPTILARLHELLHEREAQPTTAKGTIGDFPGIVGTSAPMRRLFQSIERVARFRTGVLLVGESGAGKEVIARAIHERGPHHAMPFVAVNCATLGKDLLENELFGHERGAFTGAHERKVGLFELADGGSILLDEIGEMDLQTQAKLLRVIERAEFRRVGGTTKIHVDVNVIAATNRDLRAAIASGRFREDLYYRLKVVTLRVPSLRERKEDIPALVESFVSSFNTRHGVKVTGLTPQAMRSLIEYDWPGNVRELKHVVESAAMLTDGPVLQQGLFDDAIGMAGDGTAAVANVVNVADVAAAAAVSPAARVGPPPASPDVLQIQLPARLDDVERRLITATLARGLSRQQAAAALGIGVRTLYTKLRAPRPHERGVDEGGVDDGGVDEP